MKRLAIALSLLLSAPAWGVDYYVATTGTGTTCSSGSPCKLEEISNKNLEPGDNIFLADGTYKMTTPTANGHVEMSNADDGSSGSPVTFRSTNGNKDNVVVTCLPATALDDSTFVQCTAANDCDGNTISDTAYLNVYKAAYTPTTYAVFETGGSTPTITVNNATGQGCCYTSCDTLSYTFQNPMPYTQATNAAQATNADTCNKLPGCWFQTGGNLYVHMWDDGDPTTAGQNIEPAVTRRAFNASDTDYFTIRDMTVKFCGPALMELSFATGLTISNVTGSSAYSGLNIANHEGGLTFTDVTITDTQTRGDCEANNDPCATGLAAATTKGDGWCNSSVGTAFNVDSGNNTPPTTASTVTSVIARRASNAAQIMGSTNVTVTSSVFADSENHCLTLRPNSGTGTCSNISIDRSFLFNCQDAGPYISSCTGVTLRRNVLSVQTVDSDFGGAAGDSNNLHACGNLIHIGEGSSDYAFSASAGLTGWYSNYNWIPAGTTNCRWNGTRYNCRTDAGTDWYDQSSQDANSIQEASLTLAGVSYPLDPSSLAISQKALTDWYPVSGSTSIRDVVTDINCDGVVDGSDVCNAGSHCYGTAADIGPFEWGIDVSAGASVRRMLITP